jgi:hypothetical protein
MQKRCYLVSCVSVKQSVRSRAKDLYVSDWFRKARRYIELSGGPWFILSAEHGLVHPDTLIAPYERTLNKMGVRDRRDWAARVIEQMKRELPRTEEIVVLAGDKYREGLIDYLRSRASVSVPMEGLPIGKQLRWLGENAPSEAQS